jgi:hypothetical protein
VDGDLEELARIMRELPPLLDRVLAESPAVSAVAVAEAVAVAVDA